MLARVSRGGHVAKVLAHVNSRCDLHDESLSSVSTPKYEEVISEWYRVIEYLTPYVEPSRLRLYFIYDVADIDAAMAAVKPLLNHSFFHACRVQYTP